uniref:Uncharacterized protein n=1 Tax=Molossus molossus TaxID=27622 RepID=A0A7J8BM20_MOLMO|nr:hypothetical protein HJG59_010182 [Molossus molossus]
MNEDSWDFERICGPECPPCVRITQEGALPGSSAAKKGGLFSPWMTEVCRTLRSSVALSAPSLGITQEGGAAVQDGMSGVFPGGEPCLWIAQEGRGALQVSSSGQKTRSISSWLNGGSGDFRRSGALRAHPAGDHSGRWSGRARQTVSYVETTFLHSMMGVLRESFGCLSLSATQLWITQEGRGELQGSSSAKKRRPFSL